MKSLGHTRPNRTQNGLERPILWSCVAFCGLVWPFCGLLWQNIDLIGLDSYFLAVIDPNSFGHVLFHEENKSMHKHQNGDQLKKFHCLGDVVFSSLFWKKKLTHTINLSLVPFYFFLSFLNPESLDVFCLPMLFYCYFSSFLGLCSSLKTP